MILLQSWPCLFDKLIKNEFDGWFIMYVEPACRSQATNFHVSKTISIRQNYVTSDFSYELLIKNENCGRFSSVSLSKKVVAGRV